jgi:hypothetical protein
MRTLLRATGWLRAGDIWAEGSRQYQDFESYLIPGADVRAAQGRGTIAGRDGHRRGKLSRRPPLDREIEEVGRLADQGELEGVDLTDLIEGARDQQSRLDRWSNLTSK